MTYIYFVQVANGPIKIGFTKNLEVRIKSLQQNCPYELELLAHFVGSGYDEKFLHRIFHKERIHGEWFEPSKSLKSLVREIAAVDRFDSTRLYKDNVGFSVKQPENMNKSELSKLSSSHKRKSICLHYGMSESLLTKIMGQHGLKNPNKPKNLPSKLVQQICKEYVDGKVTQCELARQHGLSQGTISKIVNNVIHKSYGLHISGVAGVRLDIGYKHGT